MVVEVIVPQQTQVMAGEAWERHQRIVALRNEFENSFLGLGEELYWFESKKQYKDLGHDTFESYLADPDVDIGRRMAFMLKGVYQTFVLNLKVQPAALLPAGTDKLELLRPHVTEENVTEWLDKAAALSRSDLRREIAGAFPVGQQMPFPSGVFSVVYADPPWQYSNSGFEQSAASHYPTMAIEDVCALPVPERCNAETVLFLWATSPLLPEAFQVVKAWGFSYKANMIWDKGDAPSIGWFVKTQHEHLLIATREANRHPSIRPPSVLRVTSTRHSEKPKEIYGIIESMYPGPYCELFARNTREGWTSWGNEVAQ